MISRVFEEEEMVDSTLNFGPYFSSFYILYCFLFFFFWIYLFHKYLLKPTCNALVSRWGERYTKLAGAGANSTLDTNGLTLILSLPFLCLTLKLTLGDRGLAHRVPNRI